MVRQGQGEAGISAKTVGNGISALATPDEPEPEYLQMHLAPAADSRAAQALDDMAVESARWNGRSGK